MKGFSIYNPAWEERQRIGLWRERDHERKRWGGVGGTSNIMHGDYIIVCFLLQVAYAGRH